MFLSNFFCLPRHELLNPRPRVGRYLSSSLVSSPYGPFGLDPNLRRLGYAVTLDAERIISIHQRNHLLGQLVTVDPTLKQAVSKVDFTQHLRREILNR